PRGRIRGVVAADGDEVIHPQALQGLADLADGLGGLAGVGARGADDGATVEVDARGVVDLEVHDVLRVALHEPLEAVVAAEYAQTVVARLDGGGGEDGVDPRRGAAADEDGQRLLRAHRSAHLAARGHRPHGLDLAVAHAVDLVDHVAHHAAVVRYHRHDLADLRPRAAPGEIHHAVLLGQVHDRRLRVLEQVAVAGDRIEVGGEDLGAGVEDRALGRRLAHHRAAHAHRAVVPRRRARGHHHAVVVDVGAGAVLGDLGNVLH